MRAGHLLSSLVYDCCWSRDPETPQSITQLSLERYPRRKSEVIQFNRLQPTTAQHDADPDSRTDSLFSIATFFISSYEWWPLRLETKIPKKNTDVQHLIHWRARGKKPGPLTNTTHWWSSLVYGFIRSFRFSFFVSCCCAARLPLTFLRPETDQEALYYAHVQTWSQDSL